MFEIEASEITEFRESVRKVALKEIPKYQTPTYKNQVPRALFKSLTELGLAALSIPESLGGVDLKARTLSAVLEELAAVDCGVAIFISVHNMVAGMINRFGTDLQKREILPAMASGNWLGAFCLTEPDAGSDASNLRTEAKATADGFVLNGDKCYITSAGFADIYLVFARVDGAGADKISAFLVPAKSEGLSVSTPEKKMGTELSPIASVNFNQVKLPMTALLGSLGQGYKIALSALSGGRISIASCANGISRSAIDKALAHLEQRQQFGQKLIQFQGLQFMLADMQIKLEAARLLTLQAATQLEHDPSARALRIQSSTAKCFATDSCMSITTDAVQLLGGAGYIEDYGVERLMRDAKVLQILEGTNQIQRLVICKEMMRNKA